MALTKPQIARNALKKEFFDNRFFKFRLYRGESVFPGRIRVTTMSIIRRENQQLIADFKPGSALWSWRLINEKQFQIELGRKISGWKM